MKVDSAKNRRRNPRLPIQCNVNFIIEETTFERIDIKNNNNMNTKNVNKFGNTTAIIISNNMINTEYSEVFDVM